MFSLLLILFVQNLVLVIKKIFQSEVRFSTLRILNKNMKLMRT